MRLHRIVMKNAWRKDIPIGMGCPRRWWGAAECDETTRQGVMATRTALYEDVGAAGADIPGRQIPKHCACVAWNVLCALRVNVVFQRWVFYSVYVMYRDQCVCQCWAQGVSILSVGVHSCATLWNVCVQRIHIAACVCACVCVCVVCARV
eukprot:Opistho-2@79312